MEKVNVGNNEEVSINVEEKDNDKIIRSGDSPETSEYELVNLNSQNLLELEPSSDSDDEISFHVFCITWNMQGKVPTKSKDLTNIIPLEYDIYCISTQECERSIQNSFINQSKSEWTKLLNDHFGNEFSMLASCTLVGMHEVIFIRGDIKSKIKDVRVESIPCGFLDQFGNKGGTSISFSLHETSFLFVNCHLAAHQENSSERNTQYKKIVSELNRRLCSKTPKNSIEIENNEKISTGELGDPKKKENSSPYLAKSQSSSSLNSNSGYLSIFEHFDRVFWMGDTNYRINGNMGVILKVIELKMLDVLLNNDQLSIERREENGAFSDLEEGEIKFLPTYKYADNCDKYEESKKQRIPSYTDRILFQKKGGIKNIIKDQDIKLMEYKACQEARLSDHRPVTATFSVKCNFEKQKDKKDEVLKGDEKSSVCNVM